MRRSSLTPWGHVEPHSVLRMSIVQRHPVPRICDVTEFCACPTCTVTPFRAWGVQHESLLQMSDVSPSGSCPVLSARHPFSASVMSPRPPQVHRHPVRRKSTVVPFCARLTSDVIPSCACPLTSLLRMRSSAHAQSYACAVLRMRDSAHAVKEEPSQTEDARSFGIRTRDWDRDCNVVGREARWTRGRDCKDGGESRNVT
jgi:hypothetical protein